MKNFNIKEKLKTKRGKTTAAVTGLLLLTLVGGVAAKYVTENRSKAEMLSSDFHISSNYLEEESKNAEYTVTDWGDHGIEILLFNYEKTNVAQIAGTDMKYTVSVSDNQHWGIVVTSSSGTESDSNNEYTFKKSEIKESHKLTLTHKKCDEDGCKDCVGTEAPTTPIVVAVTTTAPYEKKLTAKFTLDGKKAPEYEVVDEGDYVVLTVYTNDYKEHIKINWTEKYSPDNTNTLMAGWLDASQTTAYLSNVTTNTTYELIFVENEECVWETDERISGTTIQIGRR